ncbi:hypothetical protein GMRT_13640 [Giardia muris]|uniref:EF-hand domain-containing protein n=1 Tax=Giardia muris TaxID=5742 RepID=A0A4Z1SRD1_GIAMU|nr:hypothetical protein GMRT_13640 [Giardia muris]|eukprot:TNJ26178.1 hypothetical protein GMRT_13640 [Giardia muris]
MSVAGSAIELVRLIDPADLETIRKLFYGRRVPLDFFSRSIQMFVPRSLTGTDAALDSIASAVVDLFEELDTDLDGYITWYDFIGYYSEASNDDSKLQQMDLANRNSVFQALMRTATNVSGKTALVTVESAIPNAAEVSDIKGSVIINMYLIRDAYYLVTDFGVYLTNSSFLFPRLIFQPTAAVLSGNPEERSNVQLDARTQERLETRAYKRLESMGLDVASIRGQALQKKRPAPEITDRREILQQMQSKRVTNYSMIACSVQMAPYPFIVLCTREPLFIVFSLTGNMAISDPFRLSSPGVCLLWNEAKSQLYIGHASGNVSVYRLSYNREDNGSSAPDPTMGNGGLGLEKESNAVPKAPPGKSRFTRSAKSAAATTSSGSGAGKLDSRVDTTTVEAALSMLGKSRDLNSLTREEIIKLYPELRSMLIDVTKTTDEAMRQSSSEKEHLRIRSKDLITLKAEDLEVASLVTSRIFNAEQSTLLSHGIKDTQLILDDPLAYIKAMVAPDPVVAATHERKHGGVHLNICAEFLMTRYITPGAVRCMDAGVGRWEDLHESNLYRIAIVGSDAALLVLDDSLNTICTFSDLHPEGIMKCYVVDDHITTIGFDNVYQIGPDAIRSCHLGMNVTKEEEELTTTDRNEPTSEPRKPGLSDTKLMDAHLVKSMHQITLVQPPRPGQPILASFAFGNIIGVVDHTNTITLLHATTGAHITRVPIATNLHGVKVGCGVYSSKNDLGYIPLGRRVFILRVVANEELAQERATWEFEAARREEERKAKSTDPRQKKELFMHAGTHLPLGSISKEFWGILINQRMAEAAVVTSPYEITILSLHNGRPIRVYNIEKLSRTLMEGEEGVTDADAEADEPVSSEYTAIETCDPSKLYVEGQSEIGESQLYFATPADEAKYRAQNRVPQVLSHIRPATQENQSLSLFAALGQRILSLAKDDKGRILYVIGTRGAITLYWKTGTLFDISNVGITGKRTADDDITIVGDPFTTNRMAAQPQNDRTGVETHIASGVSSYSIPLHLGQIVVKSNNIDSVGRMLADKSVMRTQLTATDTEKGFLFIFDSLNPQIVRAVDVKPSREYIGPVSRQLSLFDIFQGVVPDPFGGLRKGFLTYLSAKTLFVGSDDLTKPDLVERFCPTFLRQMTKTGKRKLSDTPLREMIDVMINPQLAGTARETSYVTCIEASAVLSQVAVGTSDGRILLFDTASIKFLPQGVIQHPTLDQAGAAITALCFLGAYPLLFSTNAAGLCCIHAVRPLYPHLSLVVAFAHGNYSPVRHPRAICFDTIWHRTEGFLRQALRHVTEYASDLQLCSSRYEDVIRYLIEHYAPDLLNTRYCPERKPGFNQEEVEQVIDTEFRQHHLQPKVHSNRTPSVLPTPAAASTDTSLFESMNADSSIIEKPATAAASTAPGAAQMQQIIEHRTVSNRYAYVNVSSVQSSRVNPTQTYADLFETTTEEAQEERPPEPCGIIPTHQEVVANVMQLLSMYVPLSANFRGISNKRKKTIIKIRAATLVIMLVGGYFVRFCEAPRPLFVDFLPVPEATLKPKAHTTSRTTSRRRGPEITISDRSARVIEDHAKSRYKGETSGRTENPMAEYFQKAQKSVYGDADDEAVMAEADGILYRYELKDGVRIRIPVRKESVRVLTLQSQPTCTCYISDTSTILVGDDLGYVVAYEFGTLLTTLGIAPVDNGPSSLVVTSEDGVTSRKFISQQLPRALFISANSGRTTPIASASELISIRYSHRAHASPLLHLFRANNDGSVYLTVGVDKRILAWNTSDARLMGIVQRVNLDPPPKQWNELFGGLFEAEMNASTSKASLKLSVTDLDPIVDPLAPPPMRIEAPPACAYPWTYLPDVTGLDRSDKVIFRSISQSGLTTSSVVGAARQVLASRRPVLPAPSKGDPSMLLKTTGLTNRLLERNTSSWTVRALTMRASQQGTVSSRGPVTKESK